MLLIPEMSFAEMRGRLFEARSSWANHRSWLDLGSLTIRLNEAAFGFVYSTPFFIPLFLSFFLLSIICRYISCISCIRLNIARIVFFLSRRREVAFRLRLLTFWPWFLSTYSSSLALGSSCSRASRVTKTASYCSSLPCSRSLTLALNWSFILLRPVFFCYIARNIFPIVRYSSLLCSMYCFISRTISATALGCSFCLSSSVRALGLGTSWILGRLILEYNCGGDFWSRSSRLSFIESKRGGSISVGPPLGYTSVINGVSFRVEVLCLIFLRVSCSPVAEGHRCLLLCIAGDLLRASLFF